MRKSDSIITYADYGFIKCNLKLVMKQKNITKTQLSKNTGLHHQILERYMSDTITRLDKDVLSKICYVLNCKVDDIITYVEPKGR